MYNMNTAPTVDIVDEMIAEAKRLFDSGRLDELSRVTEDMEFTCQRARGDNKEDICLTIINRLILFSTYMERQHDEIDKQSKDFMNSVNRVRAMMR